MANIGRILSKVGSGFAGGFLSGGWYGGITGGTVAGVTGGKNKPLQSLAIGAGAGFVGGVAAQKLGLQSGTTNIGPYSFRPLSSRVIEYASNLWSGGPVPPAATPGQPALPGQVPSGPGWPVPGFPLPPEISAGQGGYPAEAAPSGGADWLPVAALAGGVLLLTGSV